MPTVEDFVSRLAFFLTEDGFQKVPSQNGILYKRYSIGINHVIDIEIDDNHLFTTHIGMGISFEIINKIGVLLGIHSDDFRYVSTFRLNHEFINKKFKKLRAPTSFKMMEECINSFVLEYKNIYKPVLEEYSQIEKIDTLYNSESHSKIFYGWYYNDIFSTIASKLNNGENFDEIVKKNLIKYEKDAFMLEKFELLLYILSADDTLKI